MARGNNWNGNDDNRTFFSPYSISIRDEEDLLELNNDDQKRMNQTEREVEEGKKLE